MTVEVPAAAGTVAAKVTERLRRLLEDESQRWSSVDPDLEAPLGALASSVLSGGKRLRPTFCYWAFVGAGGDPDDAGIVDAGAALEMLHAAALIHDDVIDGSPRRHGTEAVHVRFEGEHRRHRWAGRPGHFGEGVAILVGDLALVYSSRLMGKAPPEAAAVFEEMRLEVNVGQYLDLLGAAQGVDLPGHLAIKRAERICRYKTAKYTIERPVHLGVALAAPQRLPAMADALSAFALPLGEAFQLRDDLLGVFGDPALTGKPVGDDLREGKPTLLASLTASSLSADEANTFNERFGSALLDGEGIATLQSLIEGSGSRQRVEDAISTLVERSTRALEDLPLLPQATSALVDLAEFIAGRDH
jgi:geranylgeranyl diphosphate synthase type I